MNNFGRKNYLLKVIDVFKQYVFKQSGFRQSVFKLYELQQILRNIFDELKAWQWFERMYDSLNGLHLKSNFVVQKTF